MSRITIAAINQALHDAGIKAELVKGDGYFYLIGDDVDTAPEQGIYGVSRLRDLTIQQWVDEAKHLVELANYFK